METNELTSYYQTLDLPQGASLKEVEDAYFQLRGQLICAERRSEIPPIKTAYTALKQHLLKGQSSESEAQSLQPATPGRPSAIAQPSQPLAEPHRTGLTSSNNVTRSPVEKLTADLSEIGIEGRISIRKNTLHIGVAVTPATSQKQITSQIYELLSGVSYGLDDVAIARIYGLAQGSQSSPKTVWKASFPYPNLQATADDKNLYSFDNRISNTLIFPGLLLIAALLNAVTGIQLLLFGVRIWVHECGHATVAWLSGYRALPLPFGWTSISLSKSLFVYLGVLTLLGLLCWTGWKEGRRWPMVLAGVGAIAQFYMTWIMPDYTFEMLTSFGGIGGEFYLSTLLLVSFYFPLPAKWRWDFYRYPAVLFAGFAFFGAFTQWKQIKSGTESIPWGTMLRGSGDAGGDMNRLVSHGWSDQRIVDTYSSLGSVCLIVILSVYIYFFLKQRNHLFLYSLWRRSQIAKG